MRHDAIYNLYGNVVSINGDGDNCVAYDANGTAVEINLTTVAAKEAELVASYNMVQLRDERNKRLAETDYWTLSDTETMTDAQTTYRQALRDITDNATSLDDVTWPEKP